MKTNTKSFAVVLSFTLAICMFFCSCTKTQNNSPTEETTKKQSEVLSFNSVSQEITAIDSSYVFCRTTNVTLLTSIQRSTAKRTVRAYLKTL